MWFAARGMRGAVAHQLQGPAREQLPWPGVLAVGGPTRVWGAQATEGDAVVLLLFSGAGWPAAFPLWPPRLQTARCDQAGSWLCMWGR